MLPVIELFTSIQGEGKYIGVPTHFVRVTSCNLRCVFRDSICDTAYSSFKPEKPLYTTNEEFYTDFEEQCRRYPKVKHLVITGGEPLLYKKDLEEFLSKYGRLFTVTIETNGTLQPLDSHVDLYSISPKLSTSVGKPGLINGYHVTEEMIKRQEKLRINISALIDLITSPRKGDYQLKFVYSDESCIDEIDDIVDSIKDHVKYLDALSQGIVMNIDNHIMLMPEGIINEQLAVHREEIAYKCIEKGWTMTDREHILIWGDKRYV